MTGKKTVASAADWPSGEQVRAKASLPGLNIEILHEVAGDGDAERLAIRFTGAPDLASGLRLAQEALLTGLFLPQAANGESTSLPFAYPNPFLQAYIDAWLNHPLIRANPFAQMHPVVRMLNAAKGG